MILCRHRGCGRTAHSVEADTSASHLPLRLTLHLGSASLSPPLFQTCLCFLLPLLWIFPFIALEMLWTLVNFAGDVKTNKLIASWDSLTLVIKIMPVFCWFGLWASCHSPHICVLLHTAAPSPGAGSCS